ncbi:MAG: AAA family ATPase [Deltaproteobacteria bacterium]|nr:AAA family ATPase [Deltaproteobacteria bacterium]
MEFAEIIGHEKEIRMIMEYFHTGRLPHALLFVGPPGIGKKTIAIKLARYLLCRKKIGNDNCLSCKKIEKGAHPDFLMIGGGGEALGIETIRWVCQETQRSPYLESRRVVIIDEAHLLTLEAANALLKTLEEPKEYNLFILVTSEEGEIPLTVRSRCVKIPFSPIKLELIKNYLIEKHGLDENKAEVVSNLSFGSLNVALFWANKENFLMRKKLAECLLGTKRSAVEITFFSEKISRNESEMYLYFLICLFRDMFVYSVTKEMSRVYNKDLLNILRQRVMEPTLIREKIELIIKTLSLLKYNVNRWTLFENLLISLADGI